MLPLRLAQIGAGAFSRTAHGPVLRRLAGGSAPALTLEGVCDADPTRPARAQAYAADIGFRRAFASIDDLLRETAPDVVVCTVQPSKTAVVLRTILERRIPALVEKPPGATVAQARELAALARQHRVTTYVAFNRRRMPVIEQAHAWAAERGGTAYIRVEMLRRHRREAAFCQETGIHAFDTLRYLAGNATHVQAWTPRIALGGTREYLARVRFQSGTIADIALLPDSHGTRETYRLEHGADVLEVSVAPVSAHATWRGSRLFTDGRLVAETAADADPLVAGGFVAEYEAFLQHVAAGSLPDCTLEDAVHSMELADAVQRAYAGPLPE